MQLANMTEGRKNQFMSAPPSGAELAFFRKRERKISALAFFFAFFLLFSGSGRAYGENQIHEV